ARSRRPDHGSGGGDGIRRVVRGHRAHLPCAPAIGRGGEGSRPPPPQTRNPYLGGALLPTPSPPLVIPPPNAAPTPDAPIASAVDALNQCRAAMELAGEIVVVDDRSTDATPDIVRDWGKREPAVRLVTNVVNRGPGFSRNEGVRQSTGRFLFFLDADDVFY